MLMCMRDVGAANILLHILIVGNWLNHFVKYILVSLFIKLSNASTMSKNKEIYCGECDKLLYEDACGYGECKVNGDKCYCGDLCHLTHGKP